MNIALLKKVITALGGFFLLLGPFMIISHFN